MKKAISVLLAILLLAALSVTAFAAESPAVKAPVGPALGAAKNLSAEQSDALFKGEAGKDAQAAAEAAGYKGIKAQFYTISGKDGKITITNNKDLVAVYVMKEDNGKFTFEKVNADIKKNDNGKVESASFDVTVGQKIVIISGTAEASPNTGETVPYVLLVSALVLAAGAVLFFRKSRKANA